ncbi:MAG: hypothetical protein AB2L07_15705 [Thermoanaerobaculaceae bacterium]
MRELGSKKEVQEEKKRTEGVTDEKIERAEDHRQELDRTREVWERPEMPSLKDTAEALRRIADVLERHAGGETERHEGEVMDGVEGEHEEVSEPTREGAATEEKAAQDLDAGAAESGRYNPEVQQARRERSEAHDFLRDVSEDSEGHQEKSKAEIERISQEAKTAAEALRRF